MQLVGDGEIDESVTHIACCDKHFSPGTFRTASTSQFSGARKRAKPAGARPLQRMVYARHGHELMG